MIKVWGRNNSINVQKAMWAIGELGLPHTRDDVGGPFGGNDQDWYLKLNPNGRIPTIDDAGFVLWESNAIVRYLARKYGEGSLMPDSVRDEADADRWMDWQQTTLLGPMFTIFWGLVRTPENDRDMKAIDAATGQAAKLFGVLDKHLEGRDWMVGSRLTMGDIPVGAFAYRWYALDVQHPDHPNLKRWYETLTERPAFREHVMIPLT